jgi:Zn finger protein HypA/HybF involved in hydrogenase expression
MHEMGIASSILEAVQKELLPYPGYRAAKVKVRIGEFAGVDDESLRFCFEAIVMGSLELVIESGHGDELDLNQIELEPVEQKEVCA